MSVVQMYILLDYLNRRKHKQGTQRFFYISTFLQVLKILCRCLNTKRLQNQVGRVMFYFIDICQHRLTSLRMMRELKLNLSSQLVKMKFAHTSIKKEFTVLELNFSILLFIFVQDNHLHSWRKQLSSHVYPLCHLLFLLETEQNKNLEYIYSQSAC